MLAGGGTHSITGSSTMFLIKVIEPIHGHHPLKYRTAGFRRYSFKAGVSAGAFPRGVPKCRVLSVCILP